MTRYYSVAEHLFGISLPEDSKIWNLLGQYSPFEVESGTAVGSGGDGDYGTHGDGCGSGGDRMEAREPVFILSETCELPQGNWKTILNQPAKDGEPVVNVLRSENGWMFETSPEHNVPICAHYWISEDFSKVLIKFDSGEMSNVLFSLNNALMLAFAMSTTKLGTLEMHASMVGNGGRAYLFTAPSGTGKSTHCSLWLDNVPGSELMNDDNPILRILPDGRIMAYGSPWSGKTPCYRNVQAEVGAIVKIRRCRENSITRLSMPSAFAEIFSSCSGMKYDPELSDAICDSISSTVCTVPCYVLDCRADREAALVCAGELLKIRDNISEDT